MNDTEFNRLVEKFAEKQTEHKEYDDVVRPEVTKILEECLRIALAIKNNTKIFVPRSLDAYIVDIGSENMIVSGEDEFHRLLEEQTKLTITELPDTAVKRFQVYGDISELISETMNVHRSTLMGKVYYIIGECVGHSKSVDKEKIDVAFVEFVLEKAKLYHENMRLVGHEKAIDMMISDGDANKALEKRNCYGRVIESNLDAYEVLFINNLFCEGKKGEGVPASSEEKIITHARMFYNFLSGRTSGGVANSLVRANTHREFGIRIDPVKYANFK